MYPRRDWTFHILDEWTPESASSVNKIVWEKFPPNRRKKKKSEHPHKQFLCNGSNWF